jgi:CDP-diacylglycerol--glycerol-3-phosphate 3-phosphatidyltransferase
MLFRQQPMLAQYYDELIQVVARHSFRLTSDGGSNIIFHPPESNHHPVNSSNGFKQSAREELEQFVQSWSSRFPSKLDDLWNTDIDPDYDTAIFPLIQMGNLGICQDELVITHILTTATGCTEHSSSSSSIGSTSSLKSSNSPTSPSILSSIEPKWEVHLTSGYFNFTQHYEDIILRSTQPVKILTASPEANGFYGARGISGYVPYVSHSFSCSIHVPVETHIH